jgi:putative ABC transport system permease protein
VYVVSMDLRGPRYENTNVTTFRDEWLTRMRAVPGVESVAQVNRIPLSPGRSQTTFRLADAPEPQVVDVNAVSPEYFPLIGVAIVRGRMFTDSETDVAVVTEATARRYWPGQDPIGRAITMDGRTRQIVGVVKDAQVSQAQDAMSSYMYLPATRSAQRRISVLVRTQMDFDGFAAAVRSNAARFDATLVVQVSRLEENLAILRMVSQLTASIAGLLGLLALGLAAIGVYGVVAYVVSRRRREVGIRLTLGATAHDVQQMVLRQTLRPITIGMLVGIAGAAAASRLLERVLFGVSPFDAAAFLGAPLFLFGVAAAAALVPTRQAVKIDPMTVLRYE